MVFIYYIQPTGGPLLYGKKLTFQLEMLGLIDTLLGLRMSPGRGEKRIQLNAALAYTCLQSA